MKTLPVFQTKIKSLEIFLLLNNLKPVVRHGFYNNELKKVEEFCKKNNLFLVKSKFKVNLAENNNFSNKGLQASLTDPNAMSFVYISKDELSANKAAYFEITQDHFSLGLVLGYPKCCSFFFQQQYPIRSKLDNDYELPVLKNSTGDSFPFQNNIFLRHKDYCLLSHFPCNLNCEKSIELGNNYIDILRKNRTQLVNDLILNLKKKIKIENKVINFF